MESLQPVNEEIMGLLEKQKGSKPQVTIENIKLVLLNDPFFAGLRFNELTGVAEFHGLDGEVKKWSDTLDSVAAEYIEKVYGIYNQNKYEDAMRVALEARRYNPLLDIIEAIKWDGIPRCSEFLVKWAGAEDTPYNREVSRLIFAGGINRAYHPGCKFDDVPVLVGKQGSGKSSVIRFLAIHDNYFAEIKDVTGKEAIEQLEGAFICEIPELAAFTKISEVERIKAFITRQNDKYRRPWAKTVTDTPRRCIWIGTTNTSQFLTDLSGNRRFYPVQTNCDGYSLFDHEDECRTYILQCWAEAREKLGTEEMQPFADRKLRAVYEENQSNALQDDWRIGMIQRYLDPKPIGSFVCVYELKMRALSSPDEIKKDPTPKDSKEIGIIMSRMQGWKRSEKRRTTEEWGQQRGWEKVAERDYSDCTSTEELPL